MTTVAVGWGALLSGRNGVRSLALAGGVALHAINVYLAITILPSVVREIGGLDYYAWNTALYVIASIIGAALSTQLLTAAGPRRAYGVAASVFALGALGCAVAPTMPVMLLGRFIQGVGGGVLVALSYAMIRLVFAESLWSRAMGMVSAMWGIATLVGPAIGGIFAESGAWRLAFWAVVGVTALFVLLAITVLPKHHGAQGRNTGLPTVQLLLLTLAVLAISLGSVRPEVAWNIAGIAAALICVVLLAGIDKGARQRLLPRGTFVLGGALATLFVTMSLLTIAVTASEIYLPLFLQVLHGQSPLIAGYLAAVMAMGWAVGSILSSGVEGRWISRAIVLSPMLSLVGLIGLTLLLPQPNAGSLAVMAPVCLGLAMIGLGVGIGWPHLATRLLQVAPRDDADLAAAAITTVQLFATALGAALAGMVANLAGLTEPGGVVGTSNAALWLSGLFALAPALALLPAMRSARIVPPHHHKASAHHGAAAGE